MHPIRLRSYEFRRERQATWLELERLVARAERGGVRRLAAAQVARLPLLYHATLSSLSVARAISLDRNLLAYLESLCARAYFCVYAPKEHVLDLVIGFFRWRFPQAVRRFKGHLALAALFLLTGVLTAHVLVARNADWFYSFVDPAYAQDRTPASSTPQLREVLYHTPDEGTGGALSRFATFLFTHNARIGMLSFALGFAAGIPVYLLLFTNGLTLGAFSALYGSRGLGVEFWAWVLPHGVTELGALVICGAGGLVLAQSLVFPGRRTRIENLARRGREAGILLMGAVIMLFLAALLEGYFRQLVHAVPLRYAVALATALFWALYFGFAGRGGEA